MTTKTEKAVMKYKEPTIVSYYRNYFLGCVEIETDREDFTDAYVLNSNSLYRFMSCICILEQM